MTEKPTEQSIPNDSEEEADLDATEATGEQAAADRAGSTDPAESAESAESTESEVDKWRNLAQRTQAELENYRKRMAREKMDAIQYSNLSLLEELLPIIDSFEMGLVAAKDSSAESVIYQGMSMVLKQMQNFLNDNGVEAIEAVNQPFDPNLHEAMEQRASDEVPEGNVILEIRRGYKCKDRLLRASNVVVSKGPETEAQSD
jgi:molecular chaperone GrpE